MKVRVSFTTKTIVMLLAIVLTATIVISTILIQESQERILLQQREDQVSHQRRIQLFEEILHNRMITLIDIISYKNGPQVPDINEFQQSINALKEYLMLTFQVEDVFLFSEGGLIEGSPAKVNAVVEQLVSTTRATFDSRSILSCTTVCTHYISIPIMSDSPTIPVVVLSTSMRELLYLFNRATNVHKVAIVQQGQQSSGKPALNVASQLSAANRRYLQQLFEALPADLSIDKLVIHGIGVTLGEQHVLVSMLPFNHINGDHPYLLIVQDITARVKQSERYRNIVIASAVTVFFVLSLLLYIFLNQYKTRLIDVSERLPMLAEHRFNEFYTSAAKHRRTPMFRLTDELDVVEDAANNLETIRKL